MTTKAEQAFLDLSGAETIHDALEQWQSEREALASVHDENLALTILNRRLRDALKTGERLAKELSESGTLFIPLRILSLGNMLTETVKALDGAIQQSKELCK